MVPPLLPPLLQVKRDRSQKQMDLHSGSPWETLTLTTLSRDRDLFPLLLSEARQLAQESEEGKTVVYTAWGVEWRPFGKPRRVREMKSVVLSEGVGEEIEGDLKTFMGRGKWYADRGSSFPLLALNPFQLKNLPSHSKPLSLSLHHLCALDRNPLSTRLPPPWPTRIRQVILHPSAGRFTLVQHLPSQPLRTRSHRRQTLPPPLTRS